MLSSLHVKHEKVEDVKITRLENVTKPESVNPRNYDQATDLSEDKNTFKCNQCGKSYSNSQTYRWHMRIHQYQRLKCDFCLQTLPDQKRLRHHKLTCKKFRCAHCELSFTSREACDGHTSVVHKCYKCRVCYEFKQLDSRSQVYACNEMHGSTGSRGIRSERCNFVTSSVANLRRHEQRFHDDIVWHECLVCDFRCRMEKTLQAHIVEAHGSVRNFKCGECGLLFETGPSLDVHLRKHTVMVHRCGRCLLCFKQAHALEKHASICKGDADNADHVPVQLDPLAIDKEDQSHKEIGEIDGKLVVKGERWE